jgi:crossover junction endodeoxyribonuclease RusA
MLKLSLPYPPTLNHLYPTGRHGRRHKSSEYKAWIKAAEAQFYEQFPSWLVPPVPTIKGKVDVQMFFGRPDKRRRDLANLEKAVSDFLVNVGAIHDDCLIEELLMSWHNDTDGCLVFVTEREPQDG